QVKFKLLVQFVQNASIPLVQGLEDSESKHSCLPLLAPAESSLCSPLELTDGGLSHEPESSPSLSEFGGVSERSPLVVQTHSHSRASPSPPPILHDLQQSDSTSYVLLNLAKGITASSESLIFAADGAGEDDDEGVSSGDYGIDGSAPWYLRVQELAHDSLIAATRAQLARDAKASQDARAASVSNGDHTHSLTADGDKRELPSRTSRPLSKQILRCSFEGCCRTFTWPAHLKYHLKTHRNDRMFRCGAEGCGKSFYVLQRLQVHMRTHNGEKPFICKEKNCGKKFTTAGNLKNHKRIHTGEKPHHCGICGKTFSQSGSRNVHMRKRHGEEGLSSESRETGEALTQSSLLEADGENGDGLVTMTTTVEPMNLHHAMLRSPGSADSVVVLSQPHELVTMTTEGHAYGEDVVSLL
uniref:Zinc finger protein 410 n=1 Tax=Seriola dumerili TaxID=41447 RepID=A0A3B4U3G7_SERDU